MKNKTKNKPDYLLNKEQTVALAEKLEQTARDFCQDLPHLFETTFMAMSAGAIVALQAVAKAQKLQDAPEGE